MIRTQIQLTKDQSKILKLLSREMDLSISSIIRKCIDSHISKNNLRDEDKKYQEALQVIGVSKSGKKNVALNHDLYLSGAYKK